ncbi:GntR family transcriptional regulator [Micromonospora ureilytica]|uniref:GntR family transcriptional regulator n=1 Tax=Micromonospora ureilytica TaxID=709868 RepID=UPI003557D60B
MKARRTVRRRTGRVSPSQLVPRGYRNRSDRTPRLRCDQGQREKTPDTSRHPSRTGRNVSTSGRVVYTSKQVIWLALGKTSARYGEQVPTPHYGQPRYRAIADELKERIESGAIPGGTLLPAESALSAEFQAARGTIRQAIAVLRDACLVATEHGRGTYASAKLHERGLEEGSDSETRERQIPADPELAALFDVDIDATLIEQQRVGRSNGAVRIVVRTYRLLQSNQ